MPLKISYKSCQQVFFLIKFFIFKGDNLLAVPVLTVVPLSFNDHFQPVLRSRDFFGQMCPTIRKKSLEIRGRSDCSQFLGGSRAIGKYSTGTYRSGTGTGAYFYDWMPKKSVEGSSNMLQMPGSG